MLIPSGRPFPVVVGNYRPELRLRFPDSAADHWVSFEKQSRVTFRECRSQQTQLPEFKNVIVLSEHFFNEIKEHPIPVDLVRDRELIKKACLYRYGR